MSNDIPTERQFQAANAARDQAVAAFMRKIEGLPASHFPVASQVIVERLLMALAAELSALIDDPDFRNTAGPAAIKLSNALADFRDTRWQDR